MPIPKHKVCDMKKRTNGMELRHLTLEERFWHYTDQNGPLGCWIWKGSLSRYGYGEVFLNGKRFRAHRISYRIRHGKLPAEGVLDHICRVRHCVNPDHLRVMTIGQNVLIGISPPAQNLRKTHCSRGHEFTEENTHLSPRGWRYCRACNRITKRERTAGTPSSSKLIPRNGVCLVIGCERGRDRGGLCSKHYRQRITGVLVEPVAECEPYDRADAPGAKARRRPDVPSILDQAA